jgi:hypothetical protein
MSDLARGILDLQRYLLELDVTGCAEWQDVKLQAVRLVDVDILPVGQLRPMYANQVPIGGCNVTLSNGFVLQVQVYLTKVTVHYIDEPSQRYNSAVAVNLYGLGVFSSGAETVAVRVLEVIPAVIEPFV